MKRNVLLIAMLFLGIVYGNAQKIESKKTFGGYKFTQDGNRMSMRDLVSTMESHPEALVLIKKAQNNATWSSAFAGVGGFLIGWPIGTSLGGGEPNWTLAGIGAGLVVIGIPIASSANKNAKAAVDLYNAAPETTSLRKAGTEYYMTASENGIGLAVKF